ncbi:hypothetical protein GT037_004776, partial [Alternaria burnsii]
PSCWLLQRSRRQLLSPRKYCRELGGLPFRDACSEMGILSQSLQSSSQSRIVM